MHVCAHTSLTGEMGLRDMVFYYDSVLAARKTGRIVLGTPSESRGRVSSDESLLEGRAASTPQGNELHVCIL